MRNPRAKPRNHTSVCFGGPIPVSDPQTDLRQHCWFGYIELPGLLSSPALAQEPGFPSLKFPSTVKMSILGFSK